MVLIENVFRALPGCYLVLEPTADFKIIEASDAFLKFTGNTRSIIGQGFFTVLPVHEHDPNKNGFIQARDILQKVIETKQPQHLPAQRYDTRKEDSNQPDLQYRGVRCIPVLDEMGNLSAITYVVEDVTDAEIMKQRIRLRDRNTQQQITDAVSTTQEMERMEISRELHDNINQILIASKWYLGRALQKEPVDKSLVQSGHELIEKAMEEIKELSTALLETTPEEDSLVEGLEELLGHVISSGDINIRKKIKLPDESMIGSKVKTTIFRIVQEQVANVMKHAEAKNLYLDLEFRDHNLYLSIKDDVKGFHISENKNGMGFLNMKSRVAVMDGSISIHSAPGDGCAIEVHIPLAKTISEKQKN